MIWRLALCAAALTAPLALADTADPGRPTDPAGRLRRVYRTALQDPGSGHLYEPAAELLGGARKMPASVRLPVRRPVALSQEPAPEGAAAAAEQEAEPVPALRPSLPDWRAVLDEPAVPQEELAYAYYRAGLYAEAAALYGRLREQSPDDPHLLMLLMLSKRNAGDVEAARGLLAEAKQKAGAEGWAEWMEAMIDLAEDDKEAP